MGLACVALVWAYTVFRTPFLIVLCCVLPSTHASVRTRATSTSTMITIVIAAPLLVVHCCSLAVFVVSLSSSQRCSLATLSSLTQSCSLPLPLLPPPPPPPLFLCRISTWPLWSLVLASLDSGDRSFHSRPFRCILSSISSPRTTTRACMRLVRCRRRGDGTHPHHLPWRWTCGRWRAMDTWRSWRSLCLCCVLSNVPSSRSTGLRFCLTSFLQYQRSCQKDS